jgi:hypothetical protein
MVERKKIKEHGILKMQKEKGRIIVKEKGCEIDMFFKENDNKSRFFCQSCGAPILLHDAVLCGVKCLAFLNLSLLVDQPQKAAYWAGSRLP